MSRDQRRNATIEWVEAAIVKLKQGEDAAKLIDEAVARNDGYSNPNKMSPQARSSLNEANDRLAKASRLISDR